MISANNNFGNNVGNAQQNEKRNWKIARLFGKKPDEPSKAAVLEIGMYKSPYSTFATLSIKYEMGRDSKNRVQFETGLNKENPSCLLNPEEVAGLILLCEIVEEDHSAMKTLHYMHDSGKSKLDILGSETTTVMTVTNEIGSKKIQFDATPAGFTNIHCCMPALKDALAKIRDKQINAKLDPEEFGNNNNDNDEDSPF